MKIFYADINKETNIINGFYCEEIHGSNIPEGSIPINEELWQHLISLGEIKVDSVGLSKVAFPLEGNNAFDMSFERYFSKVKPAVVEVPRTEVDLLREELTELKTMMTAFLTTMKEQS